MYLFASLRKVFDHPQEVAAFIADAARMDLYRYFKKMKWEWPGSLDDWQRYLEQRLT